MKLFNLSIAAGAAMFVTAAVAHAAPFVNVSILARPTGTSDAFSSSVSAEAGNSFDYQVRINMAAVGTTNTQGATVRMINTLANNPTSSTAGDGVNSMSFDLVDSAADGTAISFAAAGALATDTAAASWTLGSGASSGAINAGGDVENIRPAHALGVFTGVAGDLVYAGTFTVDSVTANGALNAIFSGVLSGIKINTGTSIVPNTASETGADPFFGYTPLTITAAVPEPATLAVFGLAAVGLLNRRRRA